MLRGFLTGATWCNVVWCMYSSLISFIRDMWGLKRAHKWEYLHLCACIRKHVSLDVDACVLLWFSARARPWHVCVCLPACVLTFICLHLHFKDSGQWVTAAPQCDVLLTELYNRHNDDLLRILAHTQQLRKSKEVHISGYQQQFVFLNRFISRGTDLKCRECG